jgi:hypothetical protein
MLHTIFAAAAVASLAGVATSGEGGRAVTSCELDAAWSNQSNFFSLQIFDPQGAFLLKAKEPSKISFLLLVMEKDTYDNTFARRLLKTK